MSPRTSSQSRPARWRTVRVPAETAAGAELTELILGVFRLNATLLDAAETMASAGGLTAARWQVLGGVLDQPRPVAAIARRMGLTRQSVQRLANALVDDGFAEWHDNPDHQRAKLLVPTEQAFAAIDRVAAVQHPWASTVGEQLGEHTLSRTAHTLDRLTAALEAHPPKAS